MTDGTLVAVVALIGLVAGAVAVFLTPRLVAYRLEDPPPPPGVLVLIPLVGGYLAGWKPRVTPVIEVVTAAVFAGLAVHYGQDVRLAIACWYSLLLISIAIIDLEHRLVLNRLSYPGIVVAVALSYEWKGIDLLGSIAGLAIGFAVFFAIQLIGRGRMGAGDTKLAALIGAMRGFPDLFNALALGVIIGGLAALVFLTVLRSGRKATFAYGPYLAAGAILSLLLPSGS